MGRELHGVLLGPLLGQLVVLVPVCLENPGNFRNKRIVGIGIAEQGADRQQHLNGTRKIAPLANFELARLGTNV
jgi:hypothetical protein